eukprot:4043955-Pleurochrysis_carterae.AAC.2
MHVEEVKKVNVMDVEATFEAGLRPAGPSLPELRQQMPSLLVETWALPSDMQVRLVSVGIRSSRVTELASSKLASFSGTFGDTLNIFKWLAGRASITRQEWGDGLICEERPISGNNNEIIPSFTRAACNEA